MFRGFPNVIKPESVLLSVFLLKWGQWTFLWLYPPQILDHLSRGPSSPAWIQHLLGSEQGPPFPPRLQCSGVAKVLCVLGLSTRIWDVVWGHRPWEIPFSELDGILFSAPETSFVQLKRSVPSKREFEAFGHEPFYAIWDLGEVAPLMRRCSAYISEFGWCGWTDVIRYQ